LLSAGLFDAAASWFNHQSRNSNSITVRRNMCPEILRRVEFRRHIAGNAGQVDLVAPDEVPAPRLGDQLAPVDDPFPRDRTVTGHPVNSMPSNGE